MAGGGFMSQAQSILKNNQRKKKRLFNTLEKYVKTSNDPIVIDKKASKQQLRQIKNRIQRENKEAFIKTLFYTFVLIILLYILFKFAPI